MAKALGDRDALPIVWLGLMTHYSLQMKLHASREIGEQACALAEGAIELLAPVHAELGMTLMLMGDFAESRVHFERALMGRDLSERHFIGPFSESNPYPLFVPLTLWGLGYSDQAREWSRRGISVVAKLSRPASLALAHCLAAMLCMFLRDPAGVEEHTNASITIATEYAIPFSLSLASIMRGWALGMQGRPGQGVAEMRQAISSAKEAGYAQRPRWCTFLAELEAKSKGPEAGLKTLSDGFALLESTEERFYEAELHRVKGELLLMQSDSNGPRAESCFERAREVARKQSAKSLELRATMSLARLLAKQGKRDQASTILSGIYGWFTEGFDTVDLKQAKILLKEFAK